MKICPIIHVSNLKPYHPNPHDDRRNTVICPGIDLKHKGEKEVEEIIADRVKNVRRPTRRVYEFLVKWKNLLVEEISWKHLEDLEA